MSFLSQGETDRENEAVGPDYCEYPAHYRWQQEPEIDPDMLYDDWREEQDDEA